MEKRLDDILIGIDVSITELIDALNSLSERDQQIMMIRFGFDNEKPYTEWVKTSREDTARRCGKQVNQIKQIEGKLIRKLKHSYVR